MKLLSSKCATILFVATLFGQNLSPNRFSLNTIGENAALFEGLTSNIVAEIRLMGDSLTWLGTGQGLALHDGHKVYSHQTVSELLVDGNETKFVPEGGIPAISVSGDTIAVSFSGDNGTIQVGYGLAISKAASSVQDSTGISWTYLEQPIDSETDIIKPFGEGFFRILPVTVPEANVTYDSYIYNGYLWTASWAGGLRRYNLRNPGWEIVPLPMDHQDSLSTCTGFTEVDTLDNKPIKDDYYLNPRDPSDGGNHNHKAFSVLVYEDTVWVGTANGINRGSIIDTVIYPGGNQPPIFKNCIEWVHYSYPSQGLSGNFVVGLARQVWNGKSTIWAATMNAETPGEVRGLSYTRDGGTSWNTTLLGERIYNVFSHDSLVLASSQSGLWKSYDGNNWALFEPAIDTTFLSQKQILTNIVYTSVLDQRGDADSISNLWIGTSDGLAYTSDLHGRGWNIFQTEYDSTEFYAYPNPFSPNNHNQLENEGFVRFHTGTIATINPELAIFNFAMEKVYEKSYDLNNYTGALKWNGRDMNGKIVDNGVYFIRIKYSQSANKGPQDYWDKLIVIK